MAYGDISPETPLSLTSLSPSTTQPTSATSSSESTPTVLDDDTRGNTPISIPRVVPAEEEGEEEEGNEGEGGTESAVIQRSVQVTPEVAARMKGMARTWSRPPSSVVDGSHPPRPSSGAEEMRRQGSRTPVSHRVAYICGKSTDQGVCIRYALHSPVFAVSMLFIQIHML